LTEGRAGRELGVEIREQLEAAPPIALVFWSGDGRTIDTTHSPVS
jgi:hypothetical protein